MLAKTAYSYNKPATISMDTTSATLAGLLNPRALSAPRNVSTVAAIYLGQCHPKVRPELNIGRFSPAASASCSVNDWEDALAGYLLRQAPRCVLSTLT